MTARQTVGTAGGIRQSRPPLAHLTEAGPGFDVLRGEPVDVGAGRDVQMGGDCVGRLPVVPPLQQDSDRVAERALQDDELRLLRLPRLPPGERGPERHLGVEAARRDVETSTTTSSST